MRWKSGRRSQNIEDRRGRRAAAGGGVGLLLVALVVVLLGGDPRSLLQVVGSGAGSAAPAGPPPAEQAEAADFVSVMLASTEDVWGEIFQASGQSYRQPRLILFSGRTRAGACGMGAAAMGPFYCPPNQEVYLDLTFFDDLARMGGSGDFAAAYVIGHEVGHHVQNLLGTSDQVRRLQQGRSQGDANALSVRLELQADCYAGVWAYHANRGTAVTLSPGDVDEGLRAAAAIGDDRMLSRAGRDVVPEAFTHGSSQQRQQWLRRGLESGDPQVCDTFSG
ncbi:MAG: neutral zinc metallopeptidase [Gemmatimonadetes bacterium]|nr:neutral zinc metallopeptidase [Gemmatimonadota bacterium]MBT8405685.1 neutral zinc metallopeptidase [Gemmatimonadota bacterium]NNK63435.1 flagellar biosynthesis protein FlgM [Gemmatimonadota bacterium]